MRTDFNSHLQKGTSINHNPHLTNL